jgi:uncharacterized protein DUF4160
MINAAIEYRSLCNQTRRVPTVLREKGYRFFFYMADRYEPPHIHVAKQDSAAIAVEAAVLSELPPAQRGLRPGG